MDPKSSFGNLEGIVVELYDKEKPYVRLSADRGTAEQEARKFSLAGNVVVTSAESGVRMTCDKIDGAPEPGLLTATGNVRATIRQLSIGPAKRAVAKFKTKGEKLISAAALTSLVLQGDNIWFQDAANNLTISGVTTGESRFAEDGKTVLFDVKGNPVRMVLKDKGVVFEGKSILATMNPIGKTYEIATAELAGNISAQFTGADKGKPYSFNIKANSANFNGKDATLTVNGGVTVTSDYTSLKGRMKAPKVILNLQKMTQGAATSYMPLYAVASGGNISFEDIDVGFIVSNMDELIIRGLRNSSGPVQRSISCSGKPVKVEYTPANDKTGQKCLLSANQFEGVLDDGPEDKGNSLQMASIEGYVTIVVSGTSMPAGSTQPQPWSLTMLCGQATYSRSSSLLKLVQVDRVTGKHPALPTGEGSLFAPYIDIRFKKNTFEPISIKTSKVGGGR